MFGELNRLYRDSLKPSDSMFNQYLARPLATPLVLVFRRLGFSPNQVTVLSLIPIIAGAFVWLTIPSNSSLWIGIIAVEFAYLMDCADGQLARITESTSPAGAALDFMMDEVKAFIVVGALGARWALVSPDESSPWLVTVGVLITLAIALALTRLRRSTAYAQSVGIEVVPHGRSAGDIRQQKSPIWFVEMLARCISQYPVCLPIFALFDRMDVFIIAYGVVHGLHIGRSVLQIRAELSDL